MALKVVRYGAMWVTIDTQTHKIRGRHTSVKGAETQRRKVNRKKRKGK